MHLINSFSYLTTSIADTHRQFLHLEWNKNKKESPKLHFILAVAKGSLAKKLFIYVFMWEMKELDDG